MSPHFLSYIDNKASAHQGLRVLRSPWWNTYPACTSFVGIHTLHLVLLFHTFLLVWLSDFFFRLQARARIQSRRPQMVPQPCRLSRPPPRLRQTARPASGTQYRDLLRSNTRTPLRSCLISIDTCKQLANTKQCAQDTISQQCGRIPLESRSRCYRRYQRQYQYKQQ